MPPFSHYYKRFSDRKDGNRLKDFWGIHINPNENLDIDHSHYIQNISNGHSIEFHIDYSKTYSIDFIGLPIEISNIINEYAKDMIEIRTWIHYPEAYPFNRPTWEYIMVKHNTHLNIEQKIKESVDLLNCNYQEYWSPIAQFEVQFLGFFVLVNKSIIMR